MALLNFFKKKKKEKEVKKEIEVIKKQLGEKEMTEKKIEKLEKLKKEPTSSHPEAVKREEIKIAPFVLKAPHITEKASGLQKKSQYIFKVFSGTSKPEIKKAVEEVYNVDVLKVRTIKIPRKQKGLGRSKGWREGYKKAIITIKQGQSIEVMPR